MHRKSYAQMFLSKPNSWSRRSGWPYPGDLDDCELLALIDDLTRTLLEILEPLDAEILSRADLEGQTVAQIAREIGRPEPEVAKRLRMAQQSLCRFVVLTLAPVEAAC